MATNEFIENNYMEALLRAALLLGDPRQGARVHGITISAYQNCRPDPPAVPALQDQRPGIAALSSRQSRTRP